MTSRPFIAAAAALLLATLDAPSPLAQSAPAPAPGSGKPVMGAFGIDTAQMDASVKPGDDFFKYVNGKWLATFKIPADKASYGAFDLLNDKAEEDVRALLADLGTSRPAPGSVGQKVIDLYQSWMDEAAIEARGITPLDADFKAIAAATSKADITRLMGRIDYTAPFGSYIIPAPAEPPRYVVGIAQSGLGMPVRDYYLNTGEKFDA